MKKITKLFQKWKAHYRDLKAGILEGIGFDLAQDWQHEIYEKAKPGDLIYCYMPVSEIERLEIKSGHDRRPYLIVGKEKNCLYGYPCTSTNKPTPYTHRFSWSKKNPYSQKNSYVELIDVVKIPMRFIKEEYGQLPSNCKEPIQRRINARITQAGSKKLMNLCALQVFYPGDILKTVQDTFLFMVSQNGNTITAYPISKDPEAQGPEVKLVHQKGVIVLDQLLSVSVSEVKLFYFQDPYTTSQIFSEIKEIEQQEKQEEHLLKKKMKFEKSLQNQSEKIQKVLTILDEYETSEKSSAAFTPEAVQYEKMKSKLESQVTFNGYEVGTVFVHPTHDQEFVFLFVKKDIPYGILLNYEDENDSGSQIQLSKNDLYGWKPEFFASQEEMEEYYDILLENPSCHTTNLLTSRTCFRHLMNSDHEDAATDFDALPAAV